MLAVAAVALLLVAGWLSLLPFDDREVRCGAPLLGADPPANVSIVPGTCSEMASDRLLLAGVLLAAAVLCAVGVLAERGSTSN